MKNPKEKVLVLGAGGVGAWVAKALVERGHDVFATDERPDRSCAVLFGHPSRRLALGTRRVVGVPSRG